MPVALIQFHDYAADRFIFYSGLTDEFFARFSEGGGAGRWVEAEPWLADKLLAK